jgi:hypothetical protein
MSRSKTPEDHGPDAFHVRLHVQKHAADVFMLDDGHPFGVFYAERSSLDALGGVLGAKQ